MVQTVSTEPLDEPVAVSPSSTRLAVSAVADNLLRVARSFGRARARMLAEAAHDVEWSSQIVLKHLQAEGPMRAGTIAEGLHFDPSTVSRQIAALVKDGLLERRADPQDGRACLLVLTDQAHAVLADHNQIRIDYFERVLESWTEDEMTTFAGLLARFDAAYEAADTQWLQERLAQRAARTRSIT